MYIEIVGFGIIEVFFEFVNLEGENDLKKREICVEILYLYDDN